MRRLRGQATVELALGLLIFVTVLTVGIHLAEVSWLSLKVQEAGAAALWEATGRRLHDYARLDNVHVRDRSIEVAEAVTQGRYRDYVSHGGDRGDGARLVFTHASPPRVRCRPNPHLADWADVESRSFEGNRPVFTQGGLRADSGISCTASASFAPFQMPVRFHDAEGDLFTEPNARAYPLRVCALGTAEDGACRRQYAALLDDWGLNGLEDESRPCLLDPSQCPNRGYYRLVHGVYRSLMDESAGGVPAVELEVVAHLAQAATGSRSPIGHPERFWFSYSPKETGWSDPTYPTFDEGGETWNTGTGQGSRDVRIREAYSQRADAWLGMPRGWSPRR